MRILVVEDEARVAKFLEESFKREGHEIALCRTYDETSDFVQGAIDPVEAVVMDRLLHGKDSITLLKPMRERFPEARILVLSAINTSEEKATALDLGADDYLAKPFSLVELSARLRALSRRGGGRPEGAIVQVGNLSVDPLSHIVSAGGQRLDLSNKEYLLFYTLAKSPGRVFNKFQLLDRVWDRQFDIESNVVEVTMKNLRRKLELASATAKILSKRNIGYWVEVSA